MTSILKGASTDVRSSDQLQPSEELIGQKRTALMALYGHYEKPGKKIEINPSGSSELEQHRNHLLKEQQVQQLLLANHQKNEALRAKQEEQQKAQEQERQLGVGAGLLRKMGWDGTAIGRSGAVAAKPLAAVIRPGREGLGCDSVAGQGSASSGISGPGSAYNPYVGGTGDQDQQKRKAKQRIQMLERFQRESEMG